MDHNPKKLMCAKHRPVMISSEVIWDNKKQAGSPVAQKVIFKCFDCGEERESVFKEDKKRE